MRQNTASSRSSRVHNHDRGTLIMRYVLTFAILTLLTSHTTTSYAWGELGHQIVCEIAFQELDRPARNKVRELMKNDEEFRLFSKSCTWPDNPRIRDKEHYVNLERNALRIVGQPCPTARRCVVTAILNDMRDLAITDEEGTQLRLLKSLGHWLGDIHQPLHVSFADDRGGNRISVDGPCNTNLHSVWDTCIIKQEIGRDAREVAIELRAELTDDERTAWTVGALDKETVIRWANESFEITLQQDVQYCVMKDGVCQYSTSEIRFDGSTKDVDADKDYLKAHANIVRMRLKMAAVRLADILNAIWR